MAGLVFASISGGLIAALLVVAAGNAVPLQIMTAYLGGGLCGVMLGAFGRQVWPDHG